MLHQRAGVRPLWARVALAGLGLVLLATFAACGGQGGGGSGGGGKGAPPGRVRIRIYDRLGVGQVREKCSITIGGVTKTIALDERTPAAYVEFQGQGPGQYQASFQTTVWYYHQGSLVTVSGRGQGTVTCRGNTDFELVMDPRTNPVTLSLQPR